MPDPEDQSPEAEAPDTPKEEPSDADTPNAEAAEDAEASAPESGDESEAAAGDDGADTDAPDGGEEEIDAEAAAMLAAAQEAIAIATSATGGEAPAAAAPAADPVGDAFNLPAFDAGGASTEPAPDASQFELLNGVNLNVTIELGRTRMLLEDVLRLTQGAVVELDKLAGDPVDVYVNERHVAKGEVLVLNDNFCVRINEIVDPTLTAKSKN